MNSRPATRDDYQAIIELIKADEERLLGRPSRLGVSDLREWMSRTNLADDSWLFEEDGELCAVGWFDQLPGDDVAFAVGIVHPNRKGRGLGAELAERAEARARHYGSARLHQFGVGVDEAAARLFLARGYYEVRRFYEMAIELEEAPEVPDFGIETLEMDDIEEFHAALEEAFQDHWEHHGQPFEQWWARHSANPNLDLSLWFVIREGGEMAAVSRNEANRNGGGYVAAIGVRRPWRGKGYAKALLLHTFREFFDRGLKRVTLGVDAENPTGATHLYERVGMHVEQENAVFERSFA
ncbi:MAG TPA: GNAT family N-acetyltransferase [Gaiellaceae bacterium]